MLKLYKIKIFRNYTRCLKCLKTNKQITALEDELHLSAQYITQLFKNQIGVGFLAYLTNIQMEYAKKLLLTTSLPITETAAMSGFNDYRVFTKAFKKAECITPS